MREYEKIASRVGLLVAVTALVIQVIANEIPSIGQLALLNKLLISVIVGILSFAIMEWVPRLLIREKTLCGLYIITYENHGNNLCSIVNIEHNFQGDRYSVDLYDCYLQDDRWAAVENQYPLCLDNIFYDLSPRGLHLVSNSDNYKTCIFIRFTYKTNSGSVMRYSNQEPFNEPYSGKLKKLSRGQLCEAYNRDYSNTAFCDQRLSKYGKCRYEGREGCRRREKVILDEVRKKGNYIEIPKVLYDSIVSSADPSGMPKSRKAKAKSRSKAVSDMPLQSEIKEKEEKENSLLKTDSAKGKNI